MSKISWESSEPRETESEKEWSFSKWKRLDIKLFLKFDYPAYFQEIKRRFFYQWNLVILRT